MMLPKFQNVLLFILIIELCFTRIYVESGHVEGLLGNSIDIDKELNLELNEKENEIEQQFQQQKLIEVENESLTDRDDVFSSTSKLKDLLENEVEVLNLLQTLVDYSVKQLKIINSYVAAQKRFLFPGPGDKKLDVRNPINAFLLVRKAAVDYEQAAFALYGVANFSQSVNEWVKRFRLHKNFPTLEDLNGAASALIRLQSTYQLDFESLSKGIVKPKNNHKNLIPQNVNVSKGLLARDLMYLGRQSTASGYYDQAVEWFKAAKNTSLNEIDSSALIGEINREIETAIEAHDYVLYRSGPRGYSWRTRSIPYRSETQTAQHEIEWKQFVPKFHQMQTEDEEYDHYERLCRGEQLRDKHSEKDLKCFFKFTGAEYFKISPLKLEVQSENPYIVVIHDLITDYQAQRLMELAKPKLMRSRHKGRENANVKSQKRTSHSAWIKLHEDLNMLTKLSERIELVTGLHVMFSSAAEDYQIANYGLGGLYVPHPDFLVHLPDTEGTTDWEKFIGDRIATLMIYLTDVEAGGGTVFPRLGVTLWPTKGSAAFWWNLDSSGLGDENTRHGACPVLYGDKWVSNKWIRYKDQILKAPCHLQQSRIFQRPT